MPVVLAHLPKPLLLVLLTFTSPWLAEVSALQGDSWCGTLMCVNATVNSDIATYELKSLNQLGWMAIGFGSQMANTPMVILWQTANGSMFLSQRQASGRVEPLPVTHPPRPANISSRAVSSTASVSPILAFDIPKNNDTIQSLIWAFGVSIPDADPGAEIEQHLDAGTFTLNLTKELEISSDSSSTSISQSSASVAVTAASLPAPSPSNRTLSRTNSLLVVHAALSAVGFLILLPLGALVARWARVFTPTWCTAHWFVNVVLGLPLICIGWALGPLAVAQEGREHIVTAHQICGVFLFILYLIEVALGTLVHLRRPKDGRSHPPRNIVHVLLGLAVFGLSIYQTINGVARAPSVFSASQRVVIAICIGWAGVFAGTYSIGLLFLRRQFAQERLGWNVPSFVPPLPLLPGGIRASSESVRRRANADDSSMADDGTHDVYSRPHGSGTGDELGAEAQDVASDSHRAQTEMRQVQTVPVSLTAFL